MAGLLSLDGGGGGRPPAGSAGGNGAAGPPTIGYHSYKDCTTVRHALTNRGRRRGRGRGTSFGGGRPWS